jgi:hypothetical protein
MNKLTYLLLTSSIVLADESNSMTGPGSPEYYEEGKLKYGKDIGYLDGYVGQSGYCDGVVTLEGYTDTAVEYNHWEQKGDYKCDPEARGFKT